MFPEGTRSKPGQQQPYKSGGARLALKNDTPIVPVAVNSGRCWPKKPFIKQPGLITVSWGPVISVTGKTSEQLNQEVELWIETEMRRIDPDSYPPGDVPPIARELAEAARKKASAAHDVQGEASTVAGPTTDNAAVAGQPRAEGSPSA